MTGSRKRPGGRGRGTDALVEQFFGTGGGGERRRAGRKARQLCREVYRVLAHVVPAEVEDPLLAGLTVVDVRPAPDESRLVVEVSVEPGVDVAEVLARLVGLRGWLRSEVAAAVQRKRVPELFFEVAP